MVANVVSAGLDAQLFVTRSDGFVLDLALSIRPGHTVALLGPNGAGKSTAVGVLAGLTPLDKGHVSLDGRTLDDPANHLFVPPEDRRIGVVFQHYLLFPHLNVAQNVGFGLRSTGVGRAAASEATAQWLDRLGLAPLATRKPASLSGGEAQRVALARALITEPDLLLLDEPLAALDVTTRTKSRHTLSDHLDAFEGPRLLITHDPAEAFLLADEIHIIERGSVTQVGSADDIRLRPRTGYAADLAGSNLVLGVASQGIVTVDDHLLHTASTGITGPVVASIHPRAISLHRQQPSGSPRNTWRTEVTRIEHYGDRVRVQTGNPLSLTVEVTPEAINDLQLTAGSLVWLSLKATEINVEAD